MGEQHDARAAGRAADETATGDRRTTPVGDRRAVPRGHHQSEGLLDTFPGLAYRMIDDATWTTEYASAGCLALTGWTPADLMASSPAYEDIIHPDDRARVREDVYRALASGGTFELRYRIVRRDGETREVLEHGRALREVDDGRRVLEGFVQDVTERVRAEAALRASEERLRAVVRVTSDVMWEWDMRSGIVRRGAELDASFGASPDAAGEGDAPSSRRTVDWWVSRLHPEDAERVRAGLVEALARAEAGEDVTWSDEYRFRREDGTWAVVGDRGTVLVEDGRARAVIGAMLDVSERRAFEEQLRQSAKMEAVGRLAGGVAHDFNNLLTVITGSTEFLLAACPPGDPRHEDVVDVRRAAERARDLTRQLLSFSRRQPVQPGRVHLDAFVAEAARLLQRVVGEGVRIETALDPVTPPVRADLGQLEQTLVNLVVNARDAMPEGGTVTISTYRADDGSAALAVRDTGVGMDAETRARAFEPFFTTKQTGKGTGLGLSTVFAIVHQAGGRLHLESEPGAGSTFTVLLPPDRSPDAESAGAAAAPRAAGGDETVLVVEDDPRVRRLACRALESRGYRVLEAAGGEEAVAVVAAHAGPLDLVVSDVVLPEGGGHAVIDAIARLRPGVRALLMSGYSADALPSGGNGERAVPLLEKPFTVDRLLAAVRSALDARGA